jgi:hypothetical protein
MMPAPSNKVTLHPKTCSPKQARFSETEFIHRDRHGTNVPKPFGKIHPARRRETSPYSRMHD